jgi:alkanesulfonate monooxygenase SsuD/methylene tetrahydromethanopterin reductase-like flavin-dependent oxidoreductase (luciferase family)
VVEDLRIHGNLARLGDPGPPVLLGGMPGPAMRRVGRLADGWITSSLADLSRIG